MFRVPSSAENPTFDDVFKVSFGRWFTSKKDDRVEWARRRNAATKLAANNQVSRAKVRDAERKADAAEWNAELGALRADGASRKEQVAAAKRRGEKHRSA